MGTILINATEQEIRVAMLSNTNKLENYYYEDMRIQKNVGNKSDILAARITRIEPGLEAAFVDFGGKRQGFLPFREISPEYFSRPQTEGVGIQDLLKEGQQLMVQIMKEERGTKGAALTTYITLAGCYLVLMPNTTEGGGISRRIEGDDREELKDLLSKLELPSGMSAIIRTAGVEKSVEELRWDRDVLMQQWDAIRRAYQQRSAPFLIHQESDVLTKTIRDHLRRDINEMIIDNPDFFNKAKNYIEIVRPDFSARLKLYQGDVPLFTRYQVEKQIKTAFDREIQLPSGGSVVIDRSEALISIDVNSAKATQGSDIEETAFHTNLEAAEEVARQLRLRDLGGLIVIDFIDMAETEHQREVENRLRDSTKTDRARIQIGRISRFGLLEMSRQRLQPILGETQQITCPQCHGLGSIRSVESLAMMLLRMIEEESMRKGAREVVCQLPVESATYLLNELRGLLQATEQRLNAQIKVIPNPYLTLPHYKISYISESEIESDETIKRPRSHEHIEKPLEPNLLMQQQSTAHHNVAGPAVKTIVPDRPREEPNIIRKIWQSLFGSAPAIKTPSKPDHKRRYQHAKKRPRYHRNPNQASSGGGNEERESGNSEKMRRRRPNKQRRNNRYHESRNSEMSRENE